MTFEQINAKLKKPLTRDNPKPGTYLFFTDDEQGETAMVCINEIIKVIPDRNLKEVFELVIRDPDDKNREFVLTPTGSVWVIEIKP